MDIGFAKHGYEVFVARITAYGRRKNPSFNFPRLGEANHPELRQTNMVSVNADRTVVNRCVTLVRIMLAFELWKIVLLPKEPPKRFIKRSETALQCGAVHFSQPFFFGFKQG
jgi:hypothetical protein